MLVKKAKDRRERFRRGSTDKGMRSIDRYGAMSEI
jgi:hypothetical protein